MQAYKMQGFLAHWVIQLLVAAFTIANITLARRVMLTTMCLVQCFRSMCLIKVKTIYEMRFSEPTVHDVKPIA